MSRVVLQNTKGILLQSYQQRIQWANWTQPTLKITNNKITALLSFFKIPVLNNLEGSVKNNFDIANTRRRFHSSKAHLTQFTKAETFHRYQPVMDVPEGLFRGELDRFKGITIKSKDEFQPDVDFVEKLKNSLEFWKENKYRTIWFHIFTEHADWIPHLAKHGFEFHHANKGFVVMYRWLPTDEYINLPAYAHTMLGVGGLVLNDDNEILVVSERFTLIPKSWKLPGGYVEPGENLVDAAIREVWEETGVKCTFQTVVAIRHTHGGGFGCSDVYVVIGLKPQNQDLKCCEREIAKAQWMKIEDYLNHPNVHQTNRQFARILQDYNKRGVRFTCEMGIHQILKKEFCMYYMKNMEEESEGNKNVLPKPDCSSKV